MKAIWYDLAYSERSEHGRQEAIEV